MRTTNRSATFGSSVDPVRVRRFLATALAVGCLSACVGPLRPAAAQQASGDNESTSQYSPLHDLLGIDPQTGRFAPAESPRVEKSDQDESDTDRQKTERRGGPSPSRTSRRDAVEDQASRAIRDFADQVDRINRGDTASLQELTAILDDRLAGDGLFQIHKRFAWFSAALLLLYPLGILLSEIFAFLATDRTTEWTDGDRRYRNSRFLRRLGQAFSIAGLIIVLTLASVTPSWWTDPVALSLVAIVTFALGLIATTLSSWNKQATREQTLSLVREVRQHQLQMRKDVEELRKRLRQVTISG